MIPFRLLDSATEHGATLRLYQRGMEFSIRVDKAGDLMNSRMHHSEDVLAELACKPIASRKDAHVLVGGLGMGFTLRAALTVLGAKARIVVSELVPAVVAWARGPMAEVFGDSLDDVRVSIRETDVGEIIRAKSSAFDAILLDVDNGPEGLTRKGNDALYSASGLTAAKKALRPGGVLAVWSSGPNPAFTKRLGRAGFDVNEVAVRATGRGGGARHVIWIAKKS